MDKRKKYFMVLDVETAGGLDNPLVYDLGFAICDKEGTIYETRSFIIEEIFNNKRLMNTAYYAKKVPEYIIDINNGIREVVSFFKAREELLNLIIEYNIQTISAYNSNFDTKALTNTIRYITRNKKAKFLTKNEKNINILCIWSYACEVLYTQKTFQRIARENKWLTEKGNLRTSAEIGYKYIACLMDFEEEHKGLDDVLIEIEILIKCIRQHKKHKAGVIPHCWRIPNNIEWEE